MPCLVETRSKYLLLTFTFSHFMFFFPRDNPSIFNHFFQDGDSMDSNRFAGSQSISSDDYFNRTSSSGRGQSNVDLQDLKDGVRQGVTKVAGKLSSIANGVVNSLQVSNRTGL